LSSSSLAGCRILVTRATHQAGKLSDGLRALGAEPVEVPVLEIRPPTTYDPLDRALMQLYSYDWLIVTSTNAVNAIVQRAIAQKISLAQRYLHVAAIGEATAEAANRAGLIVKLVPKSYHAESLVSELAHRISGKRVLLARAAIARDVIPDALRDLGANVNVVDAYRNLVPAAAPAQLRTALDAAINAATFTSSSSVTHLAEVAKQAAISFPFEGVPAISIGPVTSQTLRELLWPPTAEATTHDVPGLINAVVSSLSTR
jgi:uroporphyrinogen-III synthase/uroporphyrinogen III methyltransferase/synthase